VTAHRPREGTIGATPAAAPRSHSPAGRIARIVAVIGASTLATVAVLSYLLPGWPSALLAILIVLGTYVVAYEWDLTRDARFLRAWVGVALVTAVTSIVTGWHNGLTDEPFITPVFAQLWPNLYGHPVSLTYDQYGTVHVLSQVYDVYLPALAFAVIPGISYKWTALAAWGASVYLLRRRPEAVVLWGGLWVGLLAANGFNDFVPLLALTLAFVALAGTPSWLAEIASLALKQFANLIVVAVHLYRREWRAALLAVVVTAAILAPFAVLAPSGVVCHVLLIQPGSCGAGAGGALGPGFVHHINYLLWPLFVVAVFLPAYVRRLRATRSVGFRGRVGAFLRRWSRPSA
jgi:hypothetical protein